MKGFIGDIEQLTGDNSDFRRVLYTGKHLQLVLMALPPGGDIGEEVHKDHDQFFRIEQGEGEVLINGKRTRFKGGFGIIVPAGARHNLINTGEKPVTLYTLYGPAKHQEGTVRATRADAQAKPEQFDGKTTEEPPPA